MTSRISNPQQPESQSGTLPLSYGHQPTGSLGFRRRAVKFSYQQSRRLWGRFPTRVELRVVPGRAMELACPPMNPESKPGGYAWLVVALLVPWRC